ncbi:hypothetical protein E1B28_012154 [Marasmius oreades]|uniref:Uncharacterized protein n=1 Tax=Marasmius oreades TaxID=181124 RepID=A0A9P7UNM9_9AGAR|nr:uncharacterized protein E1B28_012154 [Marasmius oreades]KAG7088130.1 hypothetical protein E1B28_012154 [Marasmius oreades]
MLKPRKSLARLNLLFSHHKRTTSLSPIDDPSDTSSDDSSAEDGGKSDDDLEKDSETPKVPDSPPSYYDEFTLSANLEALSVSSSDTSLLDEDPFAPTPPSSPSSSRYPTLSAVAKAIPSLDYHPPSRRRSIPPRAGDTLSSSHAPRNWNGPSPSATVKCPSPLSPVKKSTEQRRTPRPRYISTPQQPSLDTLATFALRIHPHHAHVHATQRRRGKVGANLPLEPWNDDELAVFDVPSLGYSEGYYYHDDIRTHGPPKLSLPSAILEKEVQAVGLRHTKSQMNIRKSYPEKLHTRYKSVWNME